MLKIKKIHTHPSRRPRKKRLKDQNIRISLEGDCIVGQHNL